MSDEIHPRNHAINAETKQRYEEAAKGWAIGPADQESRWLWEEIAQLNAALRWAHSHV